MSSEEISCSDCRLQTIQIRWTQLLLNWINKCINTKIKADQIDAQTLGQIIKKYKEEVSTDATDKTLLSSDNIELFIKHKFPVVRLENLSECKDLSQKLYIMASILLFYCCMNSKSGKVDADICSYMEEEEQEMILKFCEVLSECDVTIDNVGSAIEEACAFSKSIKNLKDIHPTVVNKTSSEMLTELTSHDSLNSRTQFPMIEEKNKVTMQKTMDHNTKESSGNKFKSSRAVLPSVAINTSFNSKPSAGSLLDMSNFNINTQTNEVDKEIVVADSKHAAVDPMEGIHYSQKESDDQKRYCQSDCECIKCGHTEPYTGDPGSSMEYCEQKKKRFRKNFLNQDLQAEESERRTYLNGWKLHLAILVAILFVILLSTTIFMIPKKPQEDMVKSRRKADNVSIHPTWVWQCKARLCEKVLQTTSNTKFYNSLTHCTLLCMGPQLWPYPIGYTYFSKTIVALATNKLEYKFQTISSDLVHQYLAEAFSIFMKDLNSLEKMNHKPKNLTAGVKLMRMSIQVEVDSDTDPRLRTNTDETYSLQINSKLNQLLIRISSQSFCGARHGLETLSQLILLDQTSGYLITLSSATIKDSPSYKYRGLMIDTGRNFIPVPDLLRTIDGMAKCKLNTFHWRISDVTSFPLQLPEFPGLSEFGPYDRSLVYTKEHIKTVVDRAKFRCIRVLIEVAMPGPVGRPWSWCPQTSCPAKRLNTCDNVLCLRFKIKDSLFDMLQMIYSEILNLTKVDDIFHLSDGVFSISNCFNLLEDRVGYLEKALERLKRANGGFLPKLPIIWYTAHLNQDYEATAWERFGVQLNEWNLDSSIDLLSKFKIIHSFKWDLSCQMKQKRCTKYRTWQEMYSWKIWRNVEIFTVEGGEAVLWTDLVDSGNIHHHLWPRAAAVSERLWSDVIANATITRSVYTRLDSQRWRMLLGGIESQPIWPAWCSFSPATCLDKIS